jgi:outer membrane protein TolC
LIPCAGEARQTTPERFTLKQSIERALQQSAVLHAAREGVLGAEAQRREALTGFYPRFSTAYSYTHLNEDPYFVFPGIAPLLPAREMVVGTKESYAWQIEARQPLFAGGAILANYEVNRLGAAIAHQDETAAINNLVEQVQVAYFQILKAEQLLAVARQSLEQRLAHRDRAAEFFRTGFVPRNDVLHAEVEVANGRQSLLRAENTLEMARVQFNTLLRREAGAAVELEAVSGGGLPGETLDQCLAMALERRPELRAAGLRTAQARSLVKASQSEYFPTVSLVGQYARFGDTPGVNGTAYKHQESWHAMVVAQWNFWEWGKTGYRVEASRSRESQAADLLANARDQVALEVRNAYLLRNEAWQQIRVAEKAVEQAEENFRINAERYREQVGTAVGVIDAETLLTKARADHANAVMDHRIQQARLARAIGEPYRGEAQP